MYVLLHPLKDEPRYRCEIVSGWTQLEGRRTEFITTEFWTLSCVEVNQDKCDQKIKTFVVIKHPWDGLAHCSVFQCETVLTLSSRRISSYRICELMGCPEYRTVAGLSVNWQGQSGFEIHRGSHSHLRACWRKSHPLEQKEPGGGLQILCSSSQGAYFLRHSENCENGF